MRSWSTSRRTRRAATLVEVLAGLAILGTLVVSGLMIRARSLRQWRAAEDRIQAVDATDRLLATWWTGNGIPRDGEGEVPDVADLRWRTDIVHRSEDPAAPYDVVRLTVRRHSAESAEDQPVTVELILPADLEEEATP